MLVLAALPWSCRVRPGTPAPSAETLQSIAAFPVGAAVAHGLLENNAAYRNVVLREYGSLTPENAAKIEVLHPREDAFDFSDFDHIVDFAKAHDKRVHGVALIWHETGGLGWLKDFRGDAAAWERMFKTHIQTVVRRYRGKIRSWDVVNEAFNDDGTLRSDDESATDHLGSPWARNLGSDYIARAFRYAHEADPEALLFYNDFELYDAGKPKKLEAVLAMVEDFKRRGVPIHGLGVQMHIGLSADEAAIAASLRRLAATGLMIHISELDILVSDWKKDPALVYTDELQERQAEKYRFVAETYGASVPAAQRYGITVWNVGDADSWIPAAFGLRDWPLPFDGAYHKKRAYSGFLKGLRSVTAGSPGIKDYGLREYLRVSKPLPHSEDKEWRLVCGLPYNCQFQPWIEVEAPAGRTIHFNSSNPLVLYLTPTETVMTAAGRRVYEAKNWVSGEGAIYTIPAGVTVKAVKYRETGYDTEFAGSFECNDADYNTLWRKGARTVYLCMRDHFYDCPDRERVGFWGDGTPELDQCFYLFDSRAHRLCRQLVLRPLEPEFYPGQHLEFLGEYGLWFYYMHTGDLDSLRAVYNQTKTFLFETYQFGKRRQWFDWGKESKDTAVIETCFHYIDLKTLRKIALATGHEADLPAIDARLAAVRTAFDARFWTGRAYESGEVSAPDDRANAMAVNAGLADRAKWPAIYENVLSRTANASCFFDRWVFEALCAMGREEAALLRMAERYRTMIPCRFTTLWEHYDRWWASVIDAFDAGSSLNHGWNPPVLNLSQTIAGVAPEAPGWSRFHVLPKEAFLTSIKAAVPTVRGRVRVEMRKTAAAYLLRVTVPPGTSAVVGIPKRSFSRIDAIEADGRTVWTGAFRGGVAGVGWDGEDDDYWKFDAEPGTRTFVARGVLRLSSPKPPAARPVDEAALEKTGWTASASVPDGVFLFTDEKIPIDAGAANALDHDAWTGWRDLTATQHPGQWFQVDMREERSFRRIVLDNTWALWDYPRSYAVTVSGDGVHWSAPVATGAGSLGITEIAFPPQKARYIRVTQTGAHPIYHWSIYELDIHR